MNIEEQMLGGASFQRKCQLPTCQDSCKPNACPVANQPQQHSEPDNKELTKPGDPYDLDRGGNSSRPDMHANIGLSGGSKNYFRKKLIQKHNKGNNDDIIFLTSTGHNTILINCVLTENEVKSSPVF